MCVCVQGLLTGVKWIAWLSDVSAAGHPENMKQMLVFWVVTPCRLVGRYTNVSEEFNALIFRAENDAVCSSETLVYTYKSTRRNYPEEQY
jgi:hypothetical protein